MRESPRISLRSSGLRFLIRLYFRISPNLPIFVAKSNVTGMARLH